MYKKNFKIFSSPPTFIRRSGKSIRFVMPWKRLSKTACDQMIDSPCLCNRQKSKPVRTIGSIPVGVPLQNCQGREPLTEKKSPLSPHLKVSHKKGRDSER